MKRGRGQQGDGSHPHRPQGVAGSVVSVADGLKNVVFPTVAMKIMNNLIVVKEDVK